MFVGVDVGVCVKVSEKVFVDVLVGVIVCVLVDVGASKCRLDNITKMWPPMNFFCFIVHVSIILLHHQK